MVTVSVQNEEVREPSPVQFGTKINHNVQKRKMPSEKRSLIKCCIPMSAQQADSEEIDSVA
jgi:hypothetical protein